MSKRTREPASVASPWSDLIFVCSKCMRRQRREDLRDELKHALNQTGQRDLRVVACGCLDLCPKQGVTLALGQELANQPAVLRVIEAHDSAERVVAWLRGVED